MKIDKEKFNQLKQLDRIEYRQRYRSINDGGVSLKLPAWSLMIMASVFGTVGLVSSRLSLLDISLFLVQLSILTLVLDIAINTSFLIFKHKKLKKLEEEYFSVEVKKK